jgi:hypothetical protein
VEELFDLFDGLLKDKGCLAMGGQIIDATIVSAPKQHNRAVTVFRDPLSEGRGGQNTTCQIKS